MQGTSEARQSRSHEPFDIIYTRLFSSTDAVTDESWRTANFTAGDGVGGGGVTFKVSFDTRGDRTLTCLGHTVLADTRACLRAAALEERELRELTRWELMLGIWNPHPIVETMTEEMHCFGP